MPSVEARWHEFRGCGVSRFQRQGFLQCLDSVIVSIELVVGDPELRKSGPVIPLDADCIGEFGGSLAVFFHPLVGRSSQEMKLVPVVLRLRELLALVKGLEAAVETLHVEVRLGQALVGRK